MRWCGRFLAFMAALLLLCACESEKVPDLAVQKKDRIWETLGLKHPYTLVHIALYDDGGSYGGVIRGADGETLEFAWDGRVMGALPGEPRFAYIGGQHPNHLGAVPVGVGSPEENALIDVLRWWAGQYIAAEDQDSLLAICFDYSRSLEERRRALPEYTRERGQAFLALHVARILEEQQLRFLPCDTGASGYDETSPK